MEHINCRENLSAYFDGELPAPERAGVEAHLAGCPECRAELAQLGAVSKMVKTHGLEPVPPALKAAVLGGGRPAPRAWFKPVLALSAAAAGLLIVMNITKVQEPSFSDGFGARAGSDMGASATFNEAEPALPPLEPAAPAPAAPAPVVAAARAPAGERKYSSVAAVRGAYGQAKFAARSAAPMGALAGGAGSSLETPAAMEYRGPVCVYVADPSRKNESSPGLTKALAFLGMTKTRVARTAPGRLVFVKENGTRTTLEGAQLGSGLIFFDGVKDPYVVADTAAIALQYDNYFGTAGR